jgi:hypothetical protein
MDHSASEASAGGTHQCRNHAPPPPSATRRDEGASGAQSHDENTTLPQPHYTEINESFPTRSASSKTQDVSPEVVPTSNPRRSPEATDASHENVSQSQNYESIDESQNDVHTGQNYPMSLDVSSNRQKLFLFKPS